MFKGNYVHTARWLERELGRGNSRLRAQAEGEAARLEESSYPRQRDRAAWQRFQLLECINHFLNSGTAVTLVTGDLEVLSGEAELPTLEGNWRVEDLESFGSKNGWKPSPEGASRKRQVGRRGRGKLGSPADKESSKGWASTTTAGLWRKLHKDTHKMVIRSAVAVDHKRWAQCNCIWKGKYWFWLVGPASDKRAWRFSWGGCRRPCLNIFLFSLLKLILNPITLSSWKYRLQWVGDHNLKDGVFFVIDLVEF